MCTCEERGWISVKEGVDQAVEVGACGGEDDLLECGDGASGVGAVEAVPVDVEVGDDPGEDLQRALALLVALADHLLVPQYFSILWVMVMVMMRIMGMVVMMTMMMMMMMMVMILLQAQQLESRYLSWRIVGGGSAGGRSLARAVGYH